MISVMSKKPKQPAAPQAKPPTPVYLRIDDETDAALASFIRSQPVPPERTTVTLTALRKFLQEQGHYPPPKPAK
jgi:hypothetical protein